MLTSSHLLSLVNDHNLNGVPPKHSEIPILVELIAEVESATHERSQPIDNQPTSNGIARLPASLPSGGDRSHSVNR